MSKGSAIVSILVALVGGIAIGSLATSAISGGSGDDIADVSGIVPDDVERVRVPVGDRPMKGAKDALVTIVEISDFQCPFCSRVNPTMKRIMDEYQGQVRVVWRNNPLPFHKDAPLAHQAAIEAYDQGGNKKFWAMHDKLFSNQRELKRDKLEQYAKEVGLNLDKFKKALDSKKHVNVIQADQTLAKRIGANGTPHFVINGRKLSGAQPFDEFKKVIDEEITIAKKIVKAGTDKKNVYAALMKSAKDAPAPPAAAAQQAQKRPDPNAVYRVPVGAQPSKGPKDALVTVVEVSDFECPFCQRVTPTVDKIVSEYGKDVRVVWMNNPLPFHKNAPLAHQAALEAYDQGGNKKFWAMHDTLFKNRTALTRPDLEKYAQQLGLNMAQFKKALDNMEHKDVVQKEQKLARSLGAGGTPTFFINGRNLRGAQPYPAFKAVIDQELKKAKDMVAKGTPKAKVYEEIIKNGATSPKMIGGGAPSAGKPADERIYKIPSSGKAPTKGNPKAKVVIQEFSDFECPFCSRVNPTVAQILREYGSKVKIQWRHYPLPFHKNARPAHRASIEVFEQGGDKAFWKYHDLLFANRTALDKASLVKYAQQVGGIDAQKVKAAIESNKHDARIEKDIDAIKAAGARIGTPSFFINGKLVQGAQPFENFKKVIDEALKG